jgi:alpha-galactosidase
VANLGVGVNDTLTFDHPGTYQMDIDSMTSGGRDLLFQVNGGSFPSFKVAVDASTSLRYNRSGEAESRTNIIQFGDPRSYPPDLDRIVISGHGSAPRPTSTTYEAELATLAGTADSSYCQYCSGGCEAGNFGGGSGNTVTFTNVTVTESGTYQMEIDYLTSGPRSFFMSVNHAANIELNLNGSSFQSAHQHGHSGRVEGWIKHDPVRQCYWLRTCSGPYCNFPNGGVCEPDCIDYWQGWRLRSSCLEVHTEQLGNQTC